MDQDMFYDLSHVKANEVDLDAAPQSAEDYLKQVAVDRLRHKSTVVAAVDTAKFRHKQTMVYKHEDSFLNPTPSSPPLQWQHKQIADFSDLRQRLVTIRAQRVKSKTLRTFQLPEIGNEGGWKSFCFHKFTKQLDQEEFMSKLANDSGNLGDRILKHHQGTPPLLGIVLAMSQPEVIDLLEFQVAWFQDEGYSAARMHWLFALLTVLQKPFEADTCAALRDLARHCRKLRKEMVVSATETNTMDASTSADDGKTIGREYSWFIAIVGRYFDQTDLADKSN